MTSPFNPFAYKTQDQIRQMWQIRALAYAKDHGKIFRVLMRCFINEYIAVTQSTWQSLLRIAIPGYDDLQRPLLLGNARVEMSGRVTSEVINEGGVVVRMALYESKDKFLWEFRKMADKLKLNDVDRVAMFAVLGKWISEDLRVGVEGERVA